MDRKPPLIEKLEEAVFFFEQKYGFKPETIALSPSLVKVLMRILKRQNRLPAKNTTEYEFLGCEVRHLQGASSSKPWQFMLQTIRGGMKYQQTGVMNIQEVGVTEVKNIVHDGVVKLEYDDSIPEAEYLTGELADGKKD